MVGATGLEPANLPLPKRALYQAELRPDATAPPTKLTCSFAAMTVRATHLTFRDFRFNPSPTETPNNHNANVVMLLSSDVIEIQHAEIALSTIGARMIL